MPTNYPLLSVRQGNSGYFVSWLEDLGLKDFISRYKLPKLVEWGWLVPQYRVIFPTNYFLEWKDFPYLGTEPPNFAVENSLWDFKWCIEDDEEPFWFLHPFFYPDNTYRNRLEEVKDLENIPDDFIHPFLSERIIPYVDYYFHWQGYALIDVIRMADCIAPILNTPDVEEQAQGIVRIAARVKQRKASNILSLPNRWGGLAEPMTWLSHYQAFRAALSFNKNQHLFKEKGAKQLAEYLGITAEVLENAIEEKLLVLAQDWLWANERYCQWTLRAWHYLQKDIFFAVEWLCFLNDKNFGFYLDKWKYARFQRGGTWAALHKVLPYEFFEDREYFLLYAPEYNQKQYQDMLPSGEKLKRLVIHLHENNYSFDSFLNAFRQFHENLVHNPKQKGSLDFRVLLPLDYYSLLAMRTEVCLRHALEKIDSLKGMKKQGLEAYIVELARQKNISTDIIVSFENKVKKLTQLRDTPKNPIGEVMSIKESNLNEKEIYLIQAFLCCVLARNYFAHHTYLDRELIHSEESGFLLTGILVTVLILLDDLPE